MRTALILAAALFISGSAFAGEVDLTCQPQGSTAKLLIKLFQTAPGQETVETSEIRVVSEDGQTLMSASNARYQTHSDEAGRVNHVVGDLGRSGAFEIQLDENGEGEFRSTIFAPGAGVTFPDGTPVECSQIRLKPALSGSN